MTDVKELCPRSFRIDHLVKSFAVSAVLGGLCLLPMTAQAQTSNPADSGTATTSSMATSPQPLDDAGAPPAIDFTILANPAFNYAQIKRGQALGLNDDEIAEAIGIADRASVPTSDVLDRVRNGWTFQAIAENYGLKGYWRDHWYRDKLADYLAAYQATGSGALKMADNIDYSSSQNGSLNGGMPSSMSENDIIQTAQQSGEFNTFVHAVRRAGLTSTLEGNGPFTVFAPTDAAFAKLPQDQLRELMRNRSELRQVLEYHVIPASISAADAMAMKTPVSPATLEGDPLQVTTSTGQVMINSATVTTPDIQASNGVIHAIDTVLIPPTVQLGEPSGATTSNSVIMQQPGTGTAPNQDSKTPTPNAVGGTGPNMNPGSGTQNNSAPPLTGMAPNQDSKTPTPNSVNGTAPSGAVLGGATPSTSGSDTPSNNATTPDMSTTPALTVPPPSTDQSISPNGMTTPSSSNSSTPSAGGSSSDSAGQVQSTGPLTATPNQGETTPAPSNPTMAPNQGPTGSNGSSSSNLP